MQEVTFIALADIDCWWVEAEGIIKYLLLRASSRRVSSRTQARAVVFGPGRLGHLKPEVSGVVHELKEVTVTIKRSNLLFQIT